MKQWRTRRIQIELAALCLGFITAGILGKTLGNSGITFLAVSLQCFSFVWMLTGRCLPDTLGRMLRARMAKGQYKNAVLTRRCVGFSQVLAGALVAAALLFCADFLAEKVLGIPQGSFLVMLLAPAAFLQAVNGVWLGIFRGEGNELPGVISCLLRQLLILGFGFLFGGMFSEYGEKVSALLGQEIFGAMYSGMGICVAVSLTELFLFVFLLLLYRGTARNRKKREADSMRTTDSLFGVLRGLYAGMSLPILQGLLGFLPIWSGLIFYGKSVQDPMILTETYGLYAGKYMVICGVVWGVLSVFLTPLLIKTGEAFRVDEHRFAKGSFRSALKSVTGYGLYFSTVMMVLAPQLAQVFAGAETSLLEKMFTGGSFVVFLGLLVFLSMMILHTLKKRTLMLCCVVAADIAFLASVMIWMKQGQMGILALVYGGLVFLGVLAVLGCGLLVFAFDRGIDLVRTILVPAIGACLAGLFCHLLAKILVPHLGAGATVVILLILSFVLFWVINLLLRMFHEAELNEVPGGKLLRALGEMLNVF